MKILALAPQWPDPPRQGAAIRNLQILRYLADRHEVSLLAFSPEEGTIERSALGKLRHAEILSLPLRPPSARLRTLLSPGQPDMAWRLRSPQMEGRVQELCETERFDAVHVEGIEMAPYGLLALESGVPAMTYDAHNAEYLLQRRAFTTDIAHPNRAARAIYSLVQWWRLRSFERRVALRSHHVLAVSRADASALAGLSSRLRGRITILPNGVDTSYWSLEADYDRDGVSIPPGSLVFDGSMDFRPNVDAVRWFVSHVWPLVREGRPGCRFYIVGRSPSPEVLTLANEPGVEVTGGVPDTRPYVAGAAVYVVPMRMGGGVRLKVLQAMSMERAVVSTPMGAEGIDVVGGRHLLIARSPEAFARSTLSLLSDTTRSRELGAAARAFVSARYAWSSLLPSLDEIYLPGGHIEHPG